MQVFNEKITDIVEKGLAFGVGPFAGATVGFAAHRENRRHGDTGWKGAYAGDFTRDKAIGPELDKVHEWRVLPRKRYVLGKCLCG